MTSVAEARAAVRAGADAVGLVFYPRSSRHVTLAQAREIAAAVPAFVSVVALVVNPAAEDVVSLLDECRIDLLQFHGDEDEAFCSAFGRPYMKAIRMQPGLDLQATVAAYPKAAAILLDAWHEDIPGGSGTAFDWEQVLPELARERLVLAGGLSADNVAEAIRIVQPYAVDVSSGIESAPGQKSAEKMQHFVAAVNSTWR